MDYFFNFDKLSYVKGGRPDGCILCRIRDRDPEAVDLSVYRDELFVITVNLYPYNPGHLMLFPRRHLEDLRQYSAEEQHRLDQLVRAALTILDKTHRPCAYNIGYNMGPAAGASIEHLHLHIIPRYPNETGIADLLAGKRVLVESPLQTAERLQKAFRPLED